MDFEDLGINKTAVIDYGNFNDYRVEILGNTSYSIRGRVSFFNNKDVEPYVRCFKKKYIRDFYVF